MFTKLLGLTLFILAAVGSPSLAKEDAKGRILVFVKTKGFRHKSIPHGKAALLALGREHQVHVDTTSDASFFTEETLQTYDAVVFLNTSGDVLNDAQQADFERYIQAGGGFAGVHAATDTEYDWPWYNKLVGAYFDGHPKQQNATVSIEKPSHPVTKMLPVEWERFDEWYNFKSVNPEIQVLAKVDETTYEGGKMGENHPFIWVHEYDGGKAFYTAGGHREDNYTEELFLKQLWAGIEWVMDHAPLDYSRVSTARFQ